MIFDPSHLAALTAILRNGSFDAAARDLNITQSAVSQRLKALEERTGQPLILRGSPCTATAAGRKLQRHAQEVSLLEAQIARDLGLKAKLARVRIAVNADSLATWFIAAMATQEMLYEIEVDDEDHSADWLREGAVSAAVTSRSKPVQGCDCQFLGALAYIPTASPSFRQRWFADGVTPAALRQAPMLTFNAKDQLQLKWIEQRIGQRLHPPSHLLPSTHAFVDAALAGIGWGLNPLPLVAPYLSTGRLVSLTESEVFETPLYWQVARHVRDPLAGLTRAVRRAATAALI